MESWTSDTLSGTCRSNLLKVTLQSTYRTSIRSMPVLVSICMLLRRRRRLTRGRPSALGKRKPAPVRSGRSAAGLAPSRQILIPTYERKKFRREKVKNWTIGRQCSADSAADSAAGSAACTACTVALKADSNSIEAGVQRMMNYAALSIKCCLLLRVFY